MFFSFKIKKFTVLLLLSAFLCSPLVALAAGPVSGLNDATPDQIKSTGSLESVIGKMIAALLSVLGVVFIVLIIYAGFLWMTAAGNDSQVKKAKDIIVAAVVGLVIVMASYSITYFVIKSINIS